MFKSGIIISFGNAPVDAVSDDAGVLLNPNLCGLYLSEIKYAPKRRRKKPVKIKSRAADFILLYFFILLRKDPRPKNVNPDKITDNMKAAFPVVARPRTSPVEAPRTSGPPVPGKHAKLEFWAR